MRELRAITFGETEALKAIVERMQKTREKLPVGQVKLDLIAEDPPVVRLIVTDDHGQRTILERELTDVAAALVAYCMERRVRLPANAAKFVEIVDGNVALLIYLEKVDAARALTRRPRARPATQVA